MKQYEIYWSDLTPEAQARLKELNHENIDNSPLAIIDIEEESISEFLEANRIDALAQQELDENIDIPEEF